MTIWCGRAHQVHVGNCHVQALKLFQNSMARELLSQLILFIMTSAYARSKLVVFAYATAKCLVMPISKGNGWLSFLRQWLRFPLTYQAGKALERVPVATIPELFPGKQVGPISISPESLDRQIWHIRLDEEVLIGLTVQALGARRIFEIGTFEGGTTRLLADTAGDGAEV